MFQDMVPICGGPEQPSSTKSLKRKAHSCIIIGKGSNDLLLKANERNLLQLSRPLFCVKQKVNTDDFVNAESETIRV